MNHDKQNLTVNQTVSGRNNVFSGTGDIHVHNYPPVNLDNAWFSKHLELARKTAGPRYTPDLSVETDLWQWCSAFGRTAEWVEEFKRKLRACWQMQKRFVDTMRTSKKDPALPEWPDSLRKIGQDIAAEIEALLTDYNQLAECDDADF